MLETLSSPSINLVWPSDIVRQNRTQSTFKLPMSLGHLWMSTCKMSRPQYSLLSFSLWWYLADGSASFTNTNVSHFLLFPTLRQLLPPADTPLEEEPLRSTSEASMPAAAYSLQPPDTMGEGVSVLPSLGWVAPRRVWEWVLAEGGPELRKKKVNTLRPELND